jgi:hypothetical protein
LESVQSDAMYDAIEICSLLSRDKHSFEFTFTRTVMNLFRTGSSTVATEKCIFHHFSSTALNRLHDVYLNYGRPAIAYHDRLASGYRKYILQLEI